MHVNPAIAALLRALHAAHLPEVELSLDRMQRLLAALGNPQLCLPPVIHVAGTNGKGSTIAFLQAIYEAAGYRVHRYTSPHLVRFNERIVLAGAEITDVQLVPLLTRVKETALPVTFFEATTAAALLAFAEHAADILLLETGLGGRLDATNVITPAMSVITPIGFDHAEFLGDTLEGIAAEKAGIIKPGVPCVVGAQTAEVAQVLAKAALKVRAPLLVHGFGWHHQPTPNGISLICDGFLSMVPTPSMVGAHQYHNAALAAVIAKTGPLPVTDGAIHQGIRHATWPGRLQALTHGPLVEWWGARGPVMLDGAHNAQGAEALSAWIAAQELPVTLLCGMMQRKDAKAFFMPFIGHIAALFAVPIPNEPCYKPATLAAAAREAGITAPSTCTTLEHISSVQHPRESGILLIAGSLFLAGELLKNHG